MPINLADYFPGLTIDLKKMSYRKALRILRNGIAYFSILHTNGYSKHNIVIFMTVYIALISMFINNWVYETTHKKKTPVN